MGYGIAAELAATVGAGRATALQAAAVEGSRPAAGPARQAMPLTFLRQGDEARGVRVRGKGDVHHHLENLGFVEGASLTVVSEQAGNVIVQVKGASVALDRSIASKVIVA